jgi:hypothetical protein
MNCKHITEEIETMAVPDNRLPAAAEVSFQQMERMANTVAKSGMFGMKTPDQALTLMALAQAEGIHPMTAVRDFHIIEGRPALKADTMLARFQQAGGRVEWLTLTDKKAEAKFSHASGGTITIDWTIERAQAAGLAGRNVWKSYPRAMLRARLISEAIRTVFPSVIAGVYTPEEILDLDPEIPVSKEQAIQSFDRPGLLQSIVDEWLQQIKESSTEKDLREAIKGAMREAKEKGDTERIGVFTLAYDAQLELIREAAARAKAEAQQEAPQS